ncbi:MAG: DUF2442 domain-containing protein [Patiriisocius sp.]|uniref:DUF2442 domain-containing protein n=1 Tax=Patiriisocius sp. TaxID=2822396 RepID=UPI003EF6D100
MNTLKQNKIPKITFSNNSMHIFMPDGRNTIVELANFERLKNASLPQLENFVLSPFGIHWEQLNEDLSFEGFFK